jgi:F-type H+-transporting ATPase subunit epsilon
MPVQLTIVTPEGIRFDGPVDRVVVPGSEGDFGVLPGHERFLSPVRIGELQLEVPGANGRWAAVSDGFAEVTADKVVLMVDTCEFAGDIDTARAERARARAEHEMELLKARTEEDRNYRLEEAALQRALIRLQVAARQRNI